MENLKTYEGFFNEVSYDIKKFAGHTKPDDDIADRILRYLKTHPFTNVEKDFFPGNRYKRFDYGFFVEQDQNKNNDDPFGEETPKNKISISVIIETGKPKIYVNGENIECSLSFGRSVYNKIKENYDTRIQRRDKEYRIRHNREKKEKEIERRKRVEDLKNNLKF